MFRYVSRGRNGVQGSSVAVTSAAATTAAAGGTRTISPVSTTTEQRRQKISRNSEGKVRSSFSLSSIAAPKFQAMAPEQRGRGRGRGGGFQAPDGKPQYEGGRGTNRGGFGQGGTRGRFTVPSSQPGEKINGPLNPYVPNAVGKQAQIDPGDGYEEVFISPTEHINPHHLKVELETQFGKLKEFRYKRHISFAAFFQKSDFEKCCDQKTMIVGRANLLISRAKPAFGRSDTNSRDRYADVEDELFLSPVDEIGASQLRHEVEKRFGKLREFRYRRSCAFIQFEEMTSFHKAKAAGSMELELLTIAISVGRKARRDDVYHHRDDQPVTASEILALKMAAEEDRQKDEKATRAQTQEPTSSADLDKMDADLEEANLFGGGDDVDPADAMTSSTPASTTPNGADGEDPWKSTAKYEGKVPAPAGSTPRMTEDPVPEPMPLAPQAPAGADAVKMDGATLWNVAGSVNTIEPSYWKFGQGREDTEHYRALRPLEVEEALLSRSTQTDATTALNWAPLSPSMLASAREEHNLIVVRLDDVATTKKKDGPVMLDSDLCEGLVFASLPKKEAHCHPDQGVDAYYALNARGSSMSPEHLDVLKESTNLPPANTHGGIGGGVEGKYASYSQELVAEQPLASFRFFIHVWMRQGGVRTAHPVSESTAMPYVVILPSGVPVFALSEASVQEFLEFAQYRGGSSKKQAAKNKSSQIKSSDKPLTKPEIETMYSSLKTPVLSRKEEERLVDLTINEMIPLADSLSDLVGHESLTPAAAALTGVKLHSSVANEATQAIAQAADEFVSATADAAELPTLVTLQQSWRSLPTSTCAMVNLSIRRDSTGALVFQPRRQISAGGAGDRLLDMMGNQFLDPFQSRLWSSMAFGWQRLPFNHSKTYTRYITNSAHSTTWTRLREFVAVANGTDVNRLAKGKQKLSQAMVMGDAALTEQIRLLGHAAEGLDLCQEMWRLTNDCARWGFMIPQGEVADKYYEPIDYGAKQRELPWNSATRAKLLELLSQATTQLTESLLTSRQDEDTPLEVRNATFGMLHTLVECASSLAAAHHVPRTPEELAMAEAMEKAEAAPNQADDDVDESESGSGAVETDRVKKLTKSDPALVRVQTTDPVNSRIPWTSDQLQELLSSKSGEDMEVMCPPGGVFTLYSSLDFGTAYDIKSEAVVLTQGAIRYAEMQNQFEHGSNYSRMMFCYHFNRERCATGSRCNFVHAVAPTIAKMTSDTVNQTRKGGAATSVAAMLKDYTRDQETLKQNFTKYTEETAPAGHPATPEPDALHASLPLVLRLVTMDLVEALGPMIEDEKADDTMAKRLMLAFKALKLSCYTSFQHASRAISSPQEVALCSAINDIMLELKQDYLNFSVDSALWAKCWVQWTEVQPLVEQVATGTMSKNFAGDEIGKFLELRESDDKRTVESAMLSVPWQLQRHYLWQLYSADGAEASTQDKVLAKVPPGKRMLSMDATLDHDMLSQEVLDEVTSDGEELRVLPVRSNESPYININKWSMGSTHVPGTNVVTQTVSDKKGGQNMWVQSGRNSHMMGHFNVEAHAKRAVKRLDNNKASLVRRSHFYDGDRMRLSERVELMPEDDAPTTPSAKPLLSKKTNVSALTQATTFPPGWGCWFGMGDAKNALADSMWCMSWAQCGGRLYLERSRRLTAAGTSEAAKPEEKKPAVDEQEAAPQTLDEASGDPDQEASDAKAAAAAALILRASTRKSDTFPLDARWTLEDMRLGADWLMQQASWRYFGYRNAQLPFHWNPTCTAAIRASTWTAGKGNLVILFHPPQDLTKDPHGSLPLQRAIQAASALGPVSVIHWQLTGADLASKAGSTEVPTLDVLFQQYPQMRALVQSHLIHTKTSDGKLNAVAAVVKGDNDNRIVSLVSRSKTLLSQLLD